MRVSFTPSGRRQFLDRVAYVIEENPSAAAAMLERATDGLSRLESFPDSGRKIPEFPALPYREVLVHPYRFFYRRVGDSVWVVAVWHDRQMPGNLADSGGPQS